MRVFQNEKTRPLLLKTSSGSLERHVPQKFLQIFTKQRGGFLILTVAGLHPQAKRHPSPFP
jgi:hypothetical protein